jgi:indolepyruvate ferredoxin oxidoreductase
VAAGDAARMAESLRAAARDSSRAGAAAVEEALGDAIYLNVFLLGAAFQRGLVPLTEAASRGRWS